MTPAAFLAARFDEVEALITALDCRCSDDDLRADCPEYLIRDVASKRAMLQRAAPSKGPPVSGVVVGDPVVLTREVRYAGAPGLPWLLNLLLEPFSDHPDYRAEWRGPESDRG